MPDAPELFVMDLDELESSTGGLVYISDGSRPSDRLGLIVDAFPKLIAAARELQRRQLEDYDDHMAEHRADRSNVRCYRSHCGLRYGERDEYGCPAGPGWGHEAHAYDEDELAAAMVCDDPIHQLEGRRSDD